MSMFLAFSLHIELNGKGLAWGNTAIPLPLPLTARLLSSQVNSNTGFSLCMLHPFPTSSWQPPPPNKGHQWPRCQPQWVIPSLRLNAAPCRMWCDLLNVSPIVSFFSHPVAMSSHLLISPLNWLNSSLNGLHACYFTLIFPCLLKLFFQTNTVKPLSYLTSFCCLL